MSDTHKDFNPSGKVVVDNIKEHTDNLIDYLKDNVPDNRSRSIAITNFQQAAMWAVRANFED